MIFKDPKNNSDEKLNYRIIRKRYDKKAWGS